MDSYNTCHNLFNIFSVFLWRNNYFFNFFGFSSVTCFGFTLVSEILVLIYSPVDSAALSTTENFQEAIFGATSPVSSNCFLYFLANDKNPYPLTYFLVFGSIEYHIISIY